MSIKAYKNVVKERYDGPESVQSFQDNPYACVNPIGFFCNQRLRYVLFKAVNKLRRLGIDLRAQRFLDVGCGTGMITRYLAELLGSPANITGLDLSEQRVIKARDQNPAITYLHADLLSFSSAQKWSVVTAVDVLQHFSSSDELDLALKNIFDLLEADGFFIWYDLWASDHFASPKDVDSWGFSARQMQSMARKAGFASLVIMPMFRRIGPYHSLYLCRILPFWLVSVLERVIPGPPGNIAVIFKKIGIPQ